MPIVFSRQLQDDSVAPESFLVIRSDGESVVPNCATLRPADEALELRTVLLTGDFGTFGETPLRVEVTGPLLTIEGESLLGLSTEDITPLEDGPRVVLAERFAPETLGLAGECPDGTAQVVQLTWEGGVTGPANAALGEDQRLGTLVLLEDGTRVPLSHSSTMTPTTTCWHALRKRAPLYQLRSMLDCFTTRAMMPTRPPRSESLMGEMQYTSEIIYARLPMEVCCCPIGTDGPSPSDISNISRSV